MINEYHIQTQRTGRYFTLGALHDNTQEIWLVIHGYAQLAKSFIGNFTGLDNGFRYIVAPEGLSRFYAKGFLGKPVASWMTTEDREYEITDYIYYLDTLTKQIIPADFNGKLVVLGFSQGVATASRWIHATTQPIDEFIIYAGEIGAELRNPISPKIQNVPITYVTGNQDPLLKPEQQGLIMNLMQQLNARIIEFDGGHEIIPDVIEQLVQSK